MASFQVKIGWKSPRKREYKSYRSVSFQPDGKQKIQKKKQKNSKIYKIPSLLHFKPKQVGKGRERENTKIIVLFRSNTTQNRKFKKNSKKIQIFKKYHYGFISIQNRLENDEKEKK